MASDKKVRQITAFNSGEYSDKLAGRVDLEPFGKSLRFMSNFMAEPTGGIKKFYGTNFVTEIEEPADMILVPFINSYVPMCFVIMSDKVGLLYGNEYKELDFLIPSANNLRKLRWQQINDQLVFVHPDTQPFSIDFYGFDNDGEPSFISGTISFDDVPYFPIGYGGDYDYPMTASERSGTIKFQMVLEDRLMFLFPGPLQNNSTYTELRQGFAQGANFTCNANKISLIAGKNGVKSTILSATVGSNAQSEYIVTSGSGGFTTGTTYKQVRRSVSREDIIKAFIAAGYEKTIEAGNGLVIAGEKLSELDEDAEYYCELVLGQASSVLFGTPFAEDTFSTDMQKLELRGESPQEALVGRKIKIHMNTGATVVPWWQSRSVRVHDIAYSNGHYYLAETAGTCGNIQPAHLVGSASDGAVTWKYLHSGTATGSVVGVESDGILVRLDKNKYLPLIEYDNLGFDTYQWSIWGKDGVHPSQIYMQNNRLGFVCNTSKYGAWNSLSCTDNYFDMSTEQYGQQLDTSAIVHLIPNNPDNKINWVLSFNQLYMGSYSGEFNIGTTNKVFTPTTISIERVSVMGGTDVMPLKYKELSLFVGATGQEIYTIGYDYTRDDYVPKSLGYLTEHLLEQGITRMEAINNRDQNVYLVHDNGNMSILNYVSDQQILGYSRVNLEGFVEDFCYTYANNVRAAYAAVRRRDGYLCLEYVSLDNPTYMLSTEELDFGEEGASTYAAPRFAGKPVYLYDEEQQTFVRVAWPEDGVFDFGKPVHKMIIGQEMVCEIHTQPAFGRKAEGMQQQAIAMSLRLLESGAFEYGASNDFAMYLPYANWGRMDAYGELHKLFTGDATLNIPTGYAKNANEGVGPYANSTGIGINIRATTPEPFNLLSITEVYQ